MTEPDTTEAWVSLLRNGARKCFHETRNALNGLVVNLEVVRTRAGSDDSVAPFLQEAVAQSEESVRLAEASTALLELLLGSLSRDGAVQCEPAGPRRIRFRTNRVEQDRIQKALDASSARTGIRAESEPGSVILTFPLESPVETIRANE